MDKEVACAPFRRRCGGAPRPTGARPRRQAGFGAESVVKTRRRATNCACSGRAAAPDCGCAAFVSHPAIRLCVRRAHRPQRYIRKRNQTRFRAWNGERDESSFPRARSDHGSCRGRLHQSHRGLPGRHLRHGLLPCLRSRRQRLQRRARRRLSGPRGPERQQRRQLARLDRLQAEVHGCGGGFADAALHAVRLRRERRPRGAARHRHERRRRACRHPSGRVRRDVRDV
jgi:hypothetical protein